MGDCNKRNMRVLWFSNCVLGESISKGTGSWLFAMKDLLIPHIELINVTISTNSDIIHNEYSLNFKEVLLPKWPLYKGVPSIENIKRIEDILLYYDPDIIHIWGLELYWALLFVRGYIKKDFLLEIQGLLSACEELSNGLINQKEKLRFIGLKDIIKRIPRLVEVMNVKDNYDKEILSSSRYIATQSKWTKEQISCIIPKESIVFNSLRPIRELFLIENKKFKKHASSPIVVFTTISYCVPFKGLHFLIQALSQVKHRYPNILLKIAGIQLWNKKCYQRGWYENYLLNIISTNNLIDNIEFLGVLDTQQLVDELNKADIFVNPSLIESFSAASAEALSLGVPSIFAYAGALPNFAEKENVALYYSPYDYMSCAAKMIEIIENNDLSQQLSANALKSMRTRCDRSKVLEKQISIYNDYLDYISNKKER